MQPGRTRWSSARFVTTSPGTGTREETPAMPAPFHPSVAVPNSAGDGIVRATPADLAYVVALQKRNGEALGFIPRLALSEKIGLGRIWLATENGDPAGYLHHGSLAVPEVRIFQAAIQYDARRRHHGLTLVGDLLARARQAGARGVSLRCLDFLDANDFWHAAGFRRIGAEPGARGLLNVWGARLDRTGRSHSEDPFTFHTRLHPCPRCGAPTTDTWTRGAVRHRLCPRCV
jgi:N-acetylglutamate synthase-like GNAT family acetyltransferase